MNEIAHNHPPICCCPDLQRESYSHTCPLCPEHGELAQLGKLQPGECPVCHSLIGAQHTDYCQYFGTVSALSHHTPYHHQHASHPDHTCSSRCYWPETDQHAQASQPATRTSQPDTQSRTGDFLAGARTRIYPDQQPHTEVIPPSHTNTPLATPTPLVEGTHHHTGPGPFHPECRRCQGLPPE